MFELTYVLVYNPEGRQAAWVKPEDAIKRSRGISISRDCDACNAAIELECFLASQVQTVDARRWLPKNLIDDYVDVFSVI